jgi:hypothetical protein
MPNYTNDVAHPAAPPQHTPEGNVKRSTTEARQAVTVGRMRYVLAISLGLAVLVFLLAYFFISR